MVRTCHEHRYSPVNEPTTRDDCILLICAVKSSEPVMTVVASACTSSAVRAAITRIPREAFSASVVTHAEERPPRMAAPIRHVF